MGVSQLKTRTDGLASIGGYHLTPAELDAILSTMRLDMMFWRPLFGPLFGIGRMPHRPSLRESLL